MTKEENIQNLKRIKKIGLCKQYLSSIDAAIKALEQQSSEDWHDIPSEEMTLEQARQAVKDLRKKLVEQQPTSDDCVSRAEVLNLVRFNAFHVKSQIKAIENIPPVTPTQRWIPVSERLPKEGEMVSITTEDLYLAKLNPCYGWRNGNHWHTFTANGSYLIKYPIAWQPLSKTIRREER